MVPRRLNGIGPIFQQLARHLTELIQSGAIAVGERLPTEQEIARRHGVSRHTVRHALVKLRSLGLIESSQGIGSVVLHSTPQSIFTETFSSVDELIRSGRGTPLRTLSVQEVIANEKLAIELRGRAGQSYLKITGIRPTTPNSTARLAGYVEVYLDAIYSGIREVLPSLKTTIAEAIDKLYVVSIARIEQHITVCVLSKDMANALGVPAKTPALRIQRWYYTDNGRVFEIATSYYSMGNFVYQSELRRNST